MDGQEAIIIASAVRTPVGSFNGSLSSLPAHELGRIVITEALGRANIQPGEVSEVILGQVLTAAQGQNPRRAAHRNHGHDDQLRLRLRAACRGHGRTGHQERR